METGIDFDDGARSSSSSNDKTQNTKQSVQVQKFDAVLENNSDNNTSGSTTNMQHTSDIAKSLDHSPFTQKHNNK